MDMIQAIKSKEKSYSNNRSIGNYFFALLFGFVVSYVSGFFALFFGFLAYIIILIFYFTLPHYFRNFPEPWLPFKLLYILGALVRLMFLVIYFAILPYLPVSYLYGNTIVALSVLSGLETSSQIERAIVERVESQRQTTGRDLFDDNKTLKQNSDGILYSIGTDLEDNQVELIYDSSNGVISAGDILILEND